MAFSTGALGAAATPADVPVQSPPSDTVSALNFTPAPNSNLLVATAWSGEVLCWDTALQGTTPASQPKAATKHELALDNSWLHGGAKVATCGGDRMVKLWDLATNQMADIGRHDAPVRCVEALDVQVGGGTVVASGGWDKKLKYWDTRGPTAAGEVLLEEKVYAMDAKGLLLVVATADQPAAPGSTPLTTSTANKQNASRTRKIYCFDLRKPTAPIKVEPSPLQYQTRCVAAFAGQAGYLVGSIEGRVGVQNFEGMHPDRQPCYTFKCHRRTLDTNGAVTAPKTAYGVRKDVYDEVSAINGLVFHPVTGTFMTFGSDGVYITWDKDEKSRLQKPGDPAPLPITAGSFNSAGTLLAYATGYDWGQGHAYHDPSNAAQKPAIMLHRLAEQEYQRRPKGSKR